MVWLQVQKLNLKKTYNINISHFYVKKLVYLMRHVSNIRSTYFKKIKNYSINACMSILLVIKMLILAYLLNYLVFTHKSFCIKRQSSR